MSIDAEDPNDFLRWLGTHDDADREGFVARSIYGKYLSDQISTIEKAWSGRVSVCNGRAVDLERGGVGPHRSDPTRRITRRL